MPRKARGPRSPKRKKRREIGGKSPLHPDLQRTVCPGHVGIGNGRWTATTSKHYRNCNGRGNNLSRVQTRNGSAGSAAASPQARRISTKKLVPHTPNISKFPSKKTGGCGKRADAATKEIPDRGGATARHGIKMRKIVCVATALKERRKKR